MHDLAAAELIIMDLLGGSNQGYTNIYTEL